MSACNVVKSKRGASVLIVNGYSYHLNKRLDDKYYWRCTLNSSKGCGATVTTIFCTNEHTILNQNNGHGHLPEPEKR